MKRFGSALALAVAGLLLPSVASVADEPAGAVLINTCFSCHGTDGHSAGDMPAIAGKSQDFITKALMEFKKGEREGTVMTRISKGFTDQEIDAMARYFSQQ